MQISIEKTVNGYLVLSAILDDLGYFQKTYIGYTRREARDEFRADVRDARAKIIKEIAP